jgi:hypothetical protein
MCRLDLLGILDRIFCTSRIRLAEIGVHNEKPYSLYSSPVVIKDD